MRTTASKWLTVVISVCLWGISILLIASDPLIRASLYRAYNRAFTRPARVAGTTNSCCSQPQPIQFTPQSVKQAIQQGR